MKMALALLEALLVGETIAGRIDWEQIEDPVDPDGDAAMSIVQTPFDLHTVVVRCERTLRIEAGESVEEYDIDIGLYWAALGATARASHSATDTGITKEER